MISNTLQSTFRRLRWRRWIVALLVPVLLFAQGATAAYLCPQIAQAMAESAPMPVDCDASNADPDQPALCQAHCVADAQANGSAPHFMPALLSFDPHPAWLMPARLNVATRVASRYAAPVSGPPLYLLHMVLRD